VNECSILITTTRITLYNLAKIQKMQFGTGLNLTLYICLDISGVLQFRLTRTTAAICCLFTTKIEDIQRQKTGQYYMNYTLHSDLNFE